MRHDDEMTSADCLFCRLIRGDLPRHRVSEDGGFVVMLDIHPINPGHLLVVPKAHIASFYAVEDPLYTSMMLLVKRMALAIDAVFAPLQVVMYTSGVGNRHVHIHVLPVYGPYDVVPREMIDQQEARTPSAQELATVAGALTAYIDSHPP
jgi:histidine triad (HIT) family protein